MKHRKGTDMKYRIYKPWGKLVKTVNSIEEVMMWLFAEYPHLPQHYYNGVRKADSNTENGSILCWSGVEVKKGEDQMTAYTSF